MYDHSSEPNEWNNLVSLSKYKSIIEELKIHLPERKWTMRNRRTINMLLFCATLSLMDCIETHSQQRPNIVLFLVDDLGQRDVGCYGSKFDETLAIDQLAKEGMLFDNAYSTCHVCMPSRASILTGKYPARTDLTEWLGGRPEREYEKLHHGEKMTALLDDEQTLAETLHKHGYATANYGKAHLSKDPKTYGFDLIIIRFHQPTTKRCRQKRATTTRTS